MRVNEIKETKEIVVRTEYVAEDGNVFRNQEECEKYEESAFFAVSKELKRLTKPDTSQGAINDQFNCDEEVEIFDVQTEKDLENLRRYLYLKLKQNGASESTVKECFESIDGRRKDFVFDNVTYGHEVMVFWNYENDWFWVYKDGSINGFLEFHREKITKLITPTETEN